MLKLDRVCKLFKCTVVLGCSNAIICVRFSIGARHNVGNMLAKLGELRESEDSLRVKQAQLDKIEEELNSIMRVAGR